MRTCLRGAERIGHKPLDPREEPSALGGELLIPDRAGERVDEVSEVVVELTDANEEPAKEGKAVVDARFPVRVDKCPVDALAHQVVAKFSHLMQLEEPRQLAGYPKLLEDI